MVETTAIQLLLSLKSLIAANGSLSGDIYAKASRGLWLYKYNELQLQEPASSQLLISLSLLHMQTTQYSYQLLHKKLDMQMRCQRPREEQYTAMNSGGQPSPSPIGHTGIRERCQLGEVLLLAAGLSTLPLKKELEIKSDAARERWRGNVSVWRKPNQLASMHHIDIQSLTNIGRQMVQAHIAIASHRAAGHSLPASMYFGNETSISFAFVTSQLPYPSTPLHALVQAASALPAPGPDQMSQLPMCTIALAQLAKAQVTAAMQ